MSSPPSLHHLHHLPQQIINAVEKIIGQLLIYQQVMPEIRFQVFRSLFLREEAVPLLQGSEGRRAHELLLLPFNRPVVFLPLQERDVSLFYSNQFINKTRDGGFLGRGQGEVSGTAGVGIYDGVSCGAARWEKAPSSLPRDCISARAESREMRPDW